MKFLHGAALSSAIQNVIAKQPADMAVAFWGNGAGARLRLPPNAKGSRVACDARSGSCNPSALADLLGRNVDIRDVPCLHAKVYIGQEGVVVTSANASANGLGEEDSEVLETLEAGYISKSPADVRTSRQWFEAIYRKGRPVTEADLPELKTLWLERQTNRPVRGGQRSFLDILLKEPILLRNRRLKVAIVPETAVPDLVEQEYKRLPFYKGSRSEPLVDFPFFWDASHWKVKTGDLILSFLGTGAKKVEGITHDGVWRVLTVTDSGLIPVERVRNPLRLRLLKRDREELAKLVLKLVRDGVLEVSNRIMSIEDFTKVLAK